MATFEQNMKKIRGEAVYGTDMREAIAQALEGATGYDMAAYFYARWDEIMQQAGEKLVAVDFEPLDTGISQTSENFNMIITGQN